MFISLVLSSLPICQSSLVFDNVSLRRLYRFRPGCLSLVSILFSCNSSRRPRLDHLLHEKVHSLAEIWCIVSKLAGFFSSSVEVSLDSLRFDLLSLSVFWDRCYPSWIHSAPCFYLIDVIEIWFIQKAYCKFQNFGD